MSVAFRNTSCTHISFSWVWQNVAFGTSWCDRQILVLLRSRTMTKAGSLRTRPQVSKPNQDWDQMALSTGVPLVQMWQADLGVVQKQDHDQGWSYQNKTASVKQQLMIEDRDQDRQCDRNGALDHLRVRPRPYCSTLCYKGFHDKHCTIKLVLSSPQLDKHIKQLHE